MHSISRPYSQAHRPADSNECQQPAQHPVSGTANHRTHISQAQAPTFRDPFYTPGPALNLPGGHQSYYPMNILPSIPQNQIVPTPYHSTHNHPPQTPAGPSTRHRSSSTRNPTNHPVTPASARTRSSNPDAAIATPHHRQSQISHGLSPEQGSQFHPPTQNSIADTPPLSGESRRGSAFSDHAGHSGAASTPTIRSCTLQCVYKKCGATFRNDHAWRKHKQYCRHRNYDRTSYQCSFIGCNIASECSGAAEVAHGERGFTSIQEVLAHENKHHQVFLCVDCHLVFPGSERDAAYNHPGNCPERSAIPHSDVGRNNSRRNSASPKIRTQWTKSTHDLFRSIANNEPLELANLVELNYRERLMEEKGEIPPLRPAAEGLRIMDINLPNTMAIPEPCRTAMANQLIGMLKVQTTFLTSSAVAVLELHEKEKDTVREYLTELAKLLRISMTTEDGDSPSPGSGGSRNRNSAGGMNTPAIAIQDAGPTPTRHEGTGAPNTYAQAVAAGADADPFEMNPSIANPNNASLIQPKSIMSRSTSPTRNPLLASSTPAGSVTSVTQPDDSATIQITDATPAEKSTIIRAATNISENEPIQEAHIPHHIQLQYYSHIMNECVQAVFEWFMKHREILLKDCECSHNNQGTAPALHTTGEGETPSKSWRKRMKKRQMAAANATTASNSSNAANVSSDANPGAPKLCQLHQITSPTSISLPRWTHHLRRLADKGRIPEHIVSNKESFSGEIQPVDEVRHAVNNQKFKTDPDLLALVQQARKFCWQLKDWGRCSQLDELYKTIQKHIQLGIIEENEEQGGWNVVSRGGRRGRKVSHTRAPPREAAKEDEDQDEDDPVGRRRGPSRKSVVRKSETF